MNDGLDALATKRKKWVDANRENGFEEGIKRLLTELYPDNAHFIYELLQNAEDTHASVVRFTLGEKSLDFEHNGQRAFSLADVDSITSIGVSTKRDDPTSIGKFGVGFKAVFAYTNTPEVHSGNYHFRIRDLVIPDAVGRHTIGKQETIFTFPFDHHQKTARRAGLEISQGLNALGENTLLFLRSIRRIEYLLHDGAVGTQERVEHEDSLIEIRSSSPGGAEANSNWLRFEKIVQVRDEDGKTKDCRIAIAYRLEADGDGKKKKSGWRIVPLDQGQVSIFFPAERETSNLRFHLHAPFASTVARDSVRDCDANNELRDSLALLVVESLATLRDRGLLDVGFLAVLPNSRDNLRDFYQPIRAAVVEAFQTQALTPTRSGTHQCAEGLYRGPAAIQEVIGDEDLSLLTGYETPLWAKNPPQENQREANFLSDLSIDEWGWEQLASAFGKPHPYARTAEQEAANASHEEQIENWIAQKGDSWLIKCYALLGEAHDTHRKFVSLGDLRIIRVEVDGVDQHVSASEAFFPPDNEATPSRPDLRFVKPAVFNAGRSDAVKNYATSFLQYVGVRPYDAKALIERMLEEYDEGILPGSRRSHLGDIRKFVSYWKDDPVCVDMFVDIAFLYCDAPDSDKLYMPHRLYIDSPYPSTGLRELFDDRRLAITKPKQGLSNEYLGIKHFADFAVALGVMKQLEIQEYKATEMQEDHFPKTGRTTSSTIDSDFYINGLHWRNEESPFYFGQLNLGKAHSLALSKAIWKVMSEANPDVLTARYVPNDRRRHEEKSKSSFLVDYLARHRWVPDREGGFHCPKDVSKVSLHPDFVFDDRNGWLTAIGFGEEDRKRSHNYQQKNALAKSLGFDDAEHMELAQKATRGKSKEELARMAREQESSAREEFPEKPSADPERRRQKLVERRENAPARETVQRERSIEPGLASIKAEAKAYLRGAYTNGNGKLICQCCRDPMPFRLPKTDQDYFEAVLFSKGLEQQFYENYLALCPTCAAKYQHACMESREELKDKVLAADPDGQENVTLDVTLAEQPATIRFVGAHALDLKVILR